MPRSFKDTGLSFLRKSFDEIFLILTNKQKKGLHLTLEEIRILDIVTGDLEFLAQRKSKQTPENLKNSYWKP